MTATHRPAPPTGSDALLRQIDHHMRSLRFASRVLPSPRHPGRPDLALAERIAGTLRRLVIDTAQASAADRARVRAAVHYFVLNRDHIQVRVVNEILIELGRDDLVIGG